MVGWRKGDWKGPEGPGRRTNHSELARHSVNTGVRRLSLTPRHHDGNPCNHDLGDTGKGGGGGRCAVPSSEAGKGHSVAATHNPPPLGRPRLPALHPLLVTLDTPRPAASALMRTSRAARQDERGRGGRKWGQTGGGSGGGGQGSCGGFALRANSFPLPPRVPPQHDTSRPHRPLRCSSQPSPPLPASPPL